MEAQLIEFLTQNPGSNKAAMATAGLKGLSLFNAIKKLQNEGRITVDGEGADATFTLAEPVTLQEPAGPQEPEVQEPTAEPKDKKNVQNLEQPAKIAAQPTGRDNTKYKFNGGEYGKGPLVLAVVKKYVEDNPDTTFKQLKEVFADTLMPRWHVFRNEQEAIKLSANKPRYFLKHPIKLKGQKEAIVVSNQWTAALMVNFLSTMKAIGYKLK